MVENFPNKPKVLGTTECRVRTNRSILSNIDKKDYTPTAAWVGDNLLDNKLTYKIS